MEFFQKVFKLDASNFPEMFIGSFSTTFVKTVWRFFELTEVNMQKKHKNFTKVVDNGPVNNSAK